jgi:hypothetical protein
MAQETTYHLASRELQKTSSQSTLTKLRFRSNGHTTEKITARRCPRQKREPAGRNGLRSSSFENPLAKQLCRQLNRQLNGQLSDQSTSIYVLLRYQHWLPVHRQPIQRTSCYRKRVACRVHKPPVQPAVHSTSQFTAPADVHPES